MKVFISYGGPADQVTALRLQALAAVNGFTVYVPPAFTRQTSGSLYPEVVQKLSEAEVILGVVVSGLSEACRQELLAGKDSQKHMVVMCYPAFMDALRQGFGPQVVVINPDDPISAELGIVKYLQDIGAQESAKKALWGLGALALGLLILAPSDGK